MEKFKSLAEFKRWLITDGAQMRLTGRAIWNDEYHRWQDVDIAERITGWREVVNVQTNSFALRTPDGFRFWCDFGKASDWHFEEGYARLTTGTNGVILHYEIEECVMISHEMLDGSGALRLYTMVTDKQGDEFLTQRLYMGYSTQEAVDSFIEEMRGNEYTFDSELSESLTVRLDTTCECDSGMQSCYWHWDETGDDDE